MEKRKLILIEAEMKYANGHFLDWLIETTEYFKNKFKIIWFLNKNCNLNNTYIPSNIEIKKIIISNNFKRSENKLIYFIEELFFY